MLATGASITYATETTEVKLLFNSNKTTHLIALLNSSIAFLLVPK